jgi:hypothetical protein
VLIIILKTCLKEVCEGTKIHSAALHDFEPNSLAGKLCIKGCLQLKNNKGDLPSNILVYKTAAVVKTPETLAGIDFHR